MLKTFGAWRRMSSLAHVNDARQSEASASGCRRDAVLAGARFGDDACLAHPQGQQCLAERVVDLVRPV